MNPTVLLFYMYPVHVTETKKILNYETARQMREANILLTAKRSFQMKGFVFCTLLQVPGKMKDTF